jgi:hypothetical protein
MFKVRWALVSSLLVQCAVLIALGQQRVLADVWCSADCSSGKAYCSCGGSGCSCNSDGSGCWAVCSGGNCADTHDCEGPPF